MAYRYEHDGMKRQGDFVMLELVGFRKGLSKSAIGYTEFLMVDNNLETLKMVQESMQDIMRNLTLVRSEEAKERRRWLTKELARQTLAGD
jgi:hypothetical protein